MEYIVEMLNIRKEFLVWWPAMMLLQLKREKFMSIRENGAGKSLMNILLAIST